ncbi:MAG: hypothetical protein ACFBSF_04100 [Leptolyngbyaceae cyanobacterium]
MKWQRPNPSIVAIQIQRCGHELSGQDSEAIWLCAEQSDATRCPSLDG